MAKMEVRLLMLISYIGLLTAAQELSFLEALNSTAELSQLTEILSNDPGLETTLSESNNVTLLAPNNEAWASIANSSALAQLSSDPDLRSALLNYHLLAGTYSTFDNGTSFVPTFLAAPQYTNLTGGQRVKVIDRVIFGGYEQNATIVQSVNFNGGVIHVIDNVLTIPDLGSQEATAYDLTTYYETLNATSDFEIVDHLRDTTIFVPDNAAWQSINESLANLTSQDLLHLLDYHVVSGRVLYSPAIENLTVSSLSGTELYITVSADGSTAYVNDATIVNFDLLAANGVIHVIDRVLNPANISTDVPAPSDTASAQSGSSSRLAPGAIGGIVIGIIVIIAAIIIGFIALRGKRRSKPTTTKAQEGGEIESEPTSQPEPESATDFRREHVEVNVSELRSGKHANNHELAGKELGGPRFEKDGTPVLSEKAGTQVSSSRVVERFELPSDQR